MDFNFRDGTEANALSVLRTGPKEKGRLWTLTEKELDGKGETRQIPNNNWPRQETVDFNFCKCKGCGAKGGSTGDGLQL